MSPFDEARRQHDAMLVEKLQQDLGVSANMRVFDSSEGTLSPLSTQESSLAAHELRDAIARATQP